jgi:hypothetical protein
MACFLVPAAEAVVVTVVEKISEKKASTSSETSEVKEVASDEKSLHVPFSHKLKWLTYMLWGGSILLMFEHIWHGEVQPFSPFLTAMADKADMYEMLHEMSTVGVTMALLVTAVWGIICVVTSLMEKRFQSEEGAEA